MSLFNLIPNYKIGSKRIFIRIVVATAIIFLSSTATEFFIDIPYATLEVLLPFDIVIIGYLLLSKKLAGNIIFRSLLPIMIFILMEMLFLVDPKIIPATIYWLPLVPIVALLVQGPKASKFWLLGILMTHIFNTVLLSGFFGSTYELDASIGFYFAEGVLFSFSIIFALYVVYSLLGNAFFKMKLKNTELHDLKESIEFKNDTIKKYQQNLVSLLKEHLEYKKGTKFSYSSICENAAQTLGTQRVSIWLFKDDNSRIDRLHLYSAKGSDDTKVSLYRKDFPDYFETMENAPFLLANKARENEVTKAFNESYFKPLEIYSLLDCPIILDQKPIGVICCENVETEAEWNTEDVLFAQSLADFIALNFKNEKINELLEEVSVKNEELQNKSEEINEINTALSEVNKQLSYANENLEQTVAERTEKLESKNKQLTEYAFINSHLLRAPISRIMGISYLIDTNDEQILKDETVLKALNSSIKELDDIVKGIADMLHEGNQMSREDIEALMQKNKLSASKKIREKLNE
jgi:hypothetical protein